MDADKQKAEEDRQIRLIKDRMPKVYRAIKEKADVLGNDVYALVRRGIRGEPGCFYGSESDLKVGTYWHTDLPTDVAQLVERYGMSYVCMFPDQVQRGADGAH
ncbi:hypothetical protein [Variovorax sp. 3P27G3]|jgi:hypothetical protein|uniref:hypothetical protein n=1 Tax=Variovorax sp. 3P27G3 TaxID=2502214 RepID=UPI0010F72E07|nr:hypothetical protein [Variovorax sp. 3P27G3]